MFSGGREVCTVEWPTDSEMSRENGYSPDVYVKAMASSESNQNVRVRAVMGKESWETCRGYPRVS